MPKARFGTGTSRRYAVCLQMKATHSRAFRRVWQQTSMFSALKKWLEENSIQDAAKVWLGKECHQHTFRCAAHMYRIYGIAQVNERIISASGQLPPRSCSRLNSVAGIPKQQPNVVPSIAKHPIMMRCRKCDPRSNFSAKPGSMA